MFLDLLHQKSTHLTIILVLATALLANYLLKATTTDIPLTAAMQNMKPTNTLKATMTNLSHAKIVPRRSDARGAANLGWLDTKHTFSFSSYYDPRHESFGSIRVLNEDRVAPSKGFDTHRHANAEIFSYILSGELTHRDSMQRKGAESSNKDQFYRMRRGDVQFTTGGTGIAHSEQNEDKKEWVHFLQIWATPWKKGLPPKYHTSTFNEEDKRQGFVRIITPLKAGPNATLEDETAAIPTIEGTIPVHADLVFSAGIIPKGNTFEYKIGGDGATTSQKERKTYIHLPQTKGGKAQIKLAGRDDTVLKEGDGAYISLVNAGDVLTVESIGDADAEVIVLDSN